MRTTNDVSTRRDSGALSDRQPAAPTDWGVPSAACDAVLAAVHPTPADGGPCATCAFRPGTEANTTAHTITLARLCVEGLRPFHCHENPGLCRGFIAAVNLNGVPQNEDERRWQAANTLAADLYGDAIAAARDADTAVLGAAIAKAEGRS